MYTLTGNMAPSSPPEDLESFSPPLSATELIPLDSCITGPSKSCLVCNRSANCYNFGVMSCDACKMFFRRTMLLDVKYTCRRQNKCFDVNFSCLKPPYCRACRLVQCIKVGMKLNLSAILEVSNKKDDAVATLIESLLYQDSRRERVLMTNFTLENPSLDDIITSKNIPIIARDPSHEMNSSDWCFFGAYTAVKFLLGLCFMKRLDDEDKKLLLANYAAKATLLFSALRTMRAKNDKMIKPDGKDFFMEFLTKWSDFSLHFTNRVRSMLVNRLIELEITNEEFILITVLFFCNTTLDGLSEHSISIITEQRQVYSSALMQYCFLTYQQNGPSRFADLLSLCTVTNKYFEDVQYLYWVFEFHFHVKYKALVSAVI